MPENEDAPPTYAQATGSSNTSSQHPAHLEVPGSNGIPAAHRRSMEDESRPLPEGWIRQFDTTENHQYFVDTKADPPRSIWHHPYDDDQYLATLTSEDRERLQEEETLSKKRPAYLDITDDEATSPTKPTKKPSSSAELPPRPEGSTTSDHKKSSFGRKVKDKLTGMTHEERVAERKRQAEEEQRYYEAHQRFREALHRAQVSGQPQFFAKDKDGHDVYVEPPQYYNGMYSRTANHNINPWQSGVYQNTNNRFIAPPGASYGRPVGNPYYGGGLGLPLVGGLLGGALLGGLLF